MVWLLKGPVLWCGDVAIKWATVESRPLGPKGLLTISKSFSEFERIFLGFGGKIIRDDFYLTNILARKKSALKYRIALSNVRIVAYQTSCLPKRAPLSLVTINLRTQIIHLGYTKPFSISLNILDRQVGLVYINALKSFPILQASFSQSVLYFWPTYI